MASTALPTRHSLTQCSNQRGLFSSPSVQQPLSTKPQPSPLSSRGADLPAASQEWNERVDIEPLPTHERSCSVSGHDFSRAAHQPSTMGFSPCSISSTFCSLGGADLPAASQER